MQFMSICSGTLPTLSVQPFPVLSYFTLLQRSLLIVPQRSSACIVQPIPGDSVCLRLT